MLHIRARKSQKINKDLAQQIAKFTQALGGFRFFKAIIYPMFKTATKTFVKGVVMGEVIIFIVALTVLILVIKN